MNHCRTIGQQCCYDSNGEYTTNGKSAGSADYYYPMEDYLKHQVSDYFPYRACCVDSDDTTFCDDYYEIRPQHSSSRCQNNDNKKGTLHMYIHVRGGFSGVSSLLKIHEGTAFTDHYDRGG